MPSRRLHEHKNSHSSSGVACLRNCMNLQFKILSSQSLTLYIVYILTLKFSRHKRDVLSYRHLSVNFFFHRLFYTIKVCKSVYHRKIQINHQPDATLFQFIILTFIYISTYFGPSPAHHQELNNCSSSLWFYLRIVVIAVLCSWSGRPVGPTTNTARLSPRYEGKSRGCYCSH
jgi:hypothetical protein